MESMDAPRQSIITTKLDNDDIRTMGFKRLLDAVCARRAPFHH